MAKKAPAANITVQCVYNKKHKKTIDANSPDSKDIPLCDVDGGPMIAVRATVRR
jgi:hypothetical protein